MHAHMQLLCTVYSQLVAAIDINLQTRVLPKQNQILSIFPNCLKEAQFQIFSIFFLRSQFTGKINGALMQYQEKVTNQSKEIMLHFSMFIHQCISVASYICIYIYVVIQQLLATYILTYMYIHICKHIHTHTYSRPLNPTLSYQ